MLRSSFILSLSLVLLLYIYNKMHEKICITYEKKLKENTQQDDQKQIIYNAFLC